MNPKIAGLAKQIMTNGGIVEECREVLDELPDYRDGYAGWSREKLNGVAAEAEGKYNRAVDELAALLGAPTELDGPPTKPGRYWFEGALQTAKGVVSLPLQVVSVVMRGNTPSADFACQAEESWRPAFKNIRGTWWTCPEPRRKDSEK